WSATYGSDILTSRCDRRHGGRLVPGFFFFFRHQHQKRASTDEGHAEPHFPTRQTADAKVEWATLLRMPKGADQHIDDRGHAKDQRCNEHLVSRRRKRRRLG